MASEIINDEVLKKKGGRPKMRRAIAKVEETKSDAYDTIIYGYSLSQWKEILGQEPGFRLAVCIPS